MKDLPHVPPPRHDLDTIACHATVSVPEALSARRRRVRLLAPLILLLCVVVPFLGIPGQMMLAAVIAPAVMVRAAALWDVLRAPPRRQASVLLHPPTVSILLPLREEETVVAGLVAALRDLDYPAELLEVIALLEADDIATLDALRRHAPSTWRLVRLPAGRPQTKPRACNVGLALAQGDVIVVFDGEDRPEPDQARTAVAALAADGRLAVVQARLGCDHSGPGAHPLARFWALEYSVLFGAIQPALARLALPFLLGGTSNWIRAAALRDVGGWDAHNVTEDADLGIRLARAGWSFGVIDSTTWEEAPIHLGQWVRQRSRWLKGFAVTTAVHVSHPRRCAAELGLAGTLAIVAQLPATLVSAAAHPFGLWLIARGDFRDPLTLLGLGGYAISVALHLAVARREGGVAWWIAALMPAYWLLQTCALLVAVLDLIVAPAHWRKTAHGLVERRPAGPMPLRSLRVAPVFLRDAGRPPPAANAARAPAQARRDPMGRPGAEPPV
jgi:glycosyltransferase XagB